MKEIDSITEIRGFNRFYTGILGLLDRDILNSGYSLTEARVVFEIGKTEFCTANQLCAALDIDRSYMSRIVKKFEGEGLIERRVNGRDGRNMEIRLTEKGDGVFKELNGRSNEQIRNMISKLSGEEQEELIHAMRTIKRAFLERQKILRSVHLLSGI